ncbi:uncharacterized protein MELLADRAFT_92060 [Melampsora larici-populina 98AG31]|uniref:Uncharacterized protein n=1 Tax=Melampsora larici-populina (strain 98AG31 / pathotype 3-4-7) TaxID=747676 RepID=F4S1D8_MELLP|nr:uncharacterized protein MELLADRAFT_92060 [Melampsora larici-populina 98AG31]EGG01577.1 hypothetical protein MELLADRAFT_92060 [Melampsora larici-populina 98AG31]
MSLVHTITSATASCNIQTPPTPITSRLTSGANHCWINCSFYDSFLGFCSSRNQIQYSSQPRIDCLSIVSRIDHSLQVCFCLVPLKPIIATLSLI